MKTILTLLCSTLLLACADTPAAAHDTSASGKKLPPNWLAATFTCWWYDVAQAAVRDLPGVHATTMTVRYSPFGEWLVVYFGPQKQTPKRLLTTIREKGCPRATQIQQNPTPSITVHNPILAPGDTLLITIKNAQGLKIHHPESWTHTLQKTATHTRLTIRTSPDTSRSKHPLTLTTNGQTHLLPITLVKRVP